MIAEFTEKQPQYRYMNIDNRIDVIVFKYIETKTYEMPIVKEEDNSEDVAEDNEENSEDVINDEKPNDLSQEDVSLLSDEIDLDNNEEKDVISQVVYVYEVNQFTCDKSITEDMIKNNIDYYLKYQPKSKEESLEDIVEQQREQINNLSMYLLNK